MVGRVRVFAVVLALGPLGCSSSSSSGNGASPDSGAPNDEEPGNDSGTTTGPGVDGGPLVSDGATTSDAPKGSTDGGGQPVSADGSPVSPDAGGGSAAGNAGVGQFCTQACNRAAACAAMVDGGSINSTTCMTNCTTMNEQGPPNGGDVVLYRNDYVADLTSCVATVDCADTLADKAADDCQTALASSFAPSAGVVTLCQRLEASSCTQDMTSDCLTAFLPYDDATIQAITTCIEDPTCTNHEACVAKALTP